MCRPFDRHAEGGHLVHQRVEELAVLVHAQQRIAEHARRQVGRAHALLLGPAVRGLEEVEPLELDAGHRHHAELLGALEHALQGLARAHRVRRPVGIDEFAEEEGHAAVPRHVARGAEVDARQCVGEAMLPAGDLGVVVALVGRVPAEDHVAEAEAAFGGAEELVAVQVLAAQDAVDVAARNLDLDGVGRAHRSQRRVFLAVLVGHVRFLCAGQSRRDVVNERVIR